MPAPLPPDEPARLAALHRYGIRDAFADEELSDIASLAAAVCGTPSAMVTFVDADRQIFKGRTGLSIAETPRDQSFCAYTILDRRQPFVVPDTAVDPEFSQHPLVTGAPHIRFYAGVPLVVPDGPVLGSLCVIDHVPRQLTDAQVAALEALGRGVVKVLELRRVTAQLEGARRDLEAKVAERTATLTSILERISDAFVALDSEWRYTYVNRQAATLFGRTVESLVGRHIWTEFPEGVGQPFYHAYQRAVREQRPLRIEEFYPPWNRWYENRIYPSPDGLSIFFTDTTELRLANQAVEESEQRLRLAVAASGIGLWDWNVLTNEVYFSPEWKQQIGYADEELQNRIEEFQSRLHPEDAPRVMRQAADYLAHPRGDYEIEFRFRHRDGTYRSILAKASVLADGSGRAVRMLGSHVDITQREAARLELQRSREALQQLSAELLRSREDERRLVAQEMHDELGQALTALKMDVAWLLRRTPAESDPGRKLQDMAAALDQTVETVRRIAADLRPGLLDDLGLAAAVEWQAEYFQAHAEVPCTADVRLSRNPPDPLAISLFRIVQESLTNIARHAHATQVVIRLVEDDPGWTLTVADDGCGMPEGVASGGSSTGLTGMRERARLVGGSLVIESHAGQGTTVRVFVPNGATAPARG